jgi:hypothetical protein
LKNGVTAIKLTGDELLCSHLGGSLANLIIYQAFFLVAAGYAIFACAALFPSLVDDAGYAIDVRMFAFHVIANPVSCYFTKYEQMMEFKLRCRYYRDVTECKNAMYRTCIYV